MRKTLLCFIMLTIAGAMAAQDFVGNSDINSHWRERRIPVKNGGQAPGVLALLKAFHQVWQT